jgi:hypothetical protein
VCPITTCVAIFTDDPTRNRHRAGSTAAAHRGVGRVKISAEGVMKRPKRRHRQLFLGVFKIVGV